MKTADDYKVEDAINNIRYNSKLDDATKYEIINKIKEEQSHRKWVDEHNRNLENQLHPKTSSSSSGSSYYSAGGEAAGEAFAVAGGCLISLFEVPLSGTVGMLSLLCGGANILFGRSNFSNNLALGLGEILFGFACISHKEYSDDRKKYKATAKIIKDNPEITLTPEEKDQIKKNTQRKILGFLSFAAVVGGSYLLAKEDIISHQAATFFVGSAAVTVQFMNGFFDENSNSIREKRIKKYNDEHTRC